MGEPVVMVVATDRYVAEDACERIVVTYDFLPVVVGIDAARAAERRRARRRARQRGGAPGAGGRRPRRRDGRGSAHADPGPRDRAVGVHADGGQGRLRRLERRRGLDPGLHLHPGGHLGADGRRREARDGRQQGRVHRPGRRRRLRREDRAPVARGGAGALGRAAARARRHRPGGEVDRGPARALHLERARARPAAARHSGFRRRGPPAGLRLHLLARQRRLHAVRDHRPDHHLDAGARAVQAGRVPLPRLVALHQHRDRDALPRRRPSAGRVRDGAHDGRDRRRARQGPHRRPRGQPHHPGRDAVRPPAAVPGRQAARLRLGRLPGVDGEDQGAGGLGRVRDGARGGAGPRAARWASASRRTSRAPARDPTRVRTSSSRPPARSRSRPGSPPRARGTRPRSRRSSPTSSVSTSPTSRWSPATPAGSGTPSARSRRGRPS